MGMYTAFRCRARIKPKYHALIQTMLDAEADPSPKCAVGDESTASWLQLDRLAQQHPFLQELAACERSGCILSWMWCDDFKNEWYPDDDDWALSFKDGVLVFQSCIKNYDHEYQKFAKVLDVVAEQVDYCARWYEECWGPQMYLGNDQWGDAPKEPGPTEPWLWSEGT